LLSRLTTKSTSSQSSRKYILAQVQGLSLDITKLASDNDEHRVEFVHSQPGQTITWDVTLNLFGTPQDTYSNLKIVDQYPSFLSISNIKGGGTDDGSKITWDLGTKKGGQDLEFSYQGTIAANTPDTQADNIIRASATDVFDVDDDTTIIVSQSPAQFGGGIENEPGVANPISNSNSSTPKDATEKFGANGALISGLLLFPVVLISGIIFFGYRRVHQ